MTQTATIPLPGPAHAAAASGATVWCAAEGRLLTFSEAGTPIANVPAPRGLRSLAAGERVLAAVVEPRVVAWLEPRDGSVRTSLPVSGDPVLVAGGGAVWAVDRSSQDARRLAGSGSLDEPIALPGADRVAPDGARLWWTSRDDTLLHGGERPVDLGAGPDARGGLVACAGSIWCSVPGGLLRVGAWDAEPGPPLAAPEGPVDHLTCADGILVGGSGHSGLFSLDPRIDADVRHLAVDLGGPLDHLVAAHAVVWAFAAGRSEATLVTVRPGRPAGQVPPNA